MKVHFSAGWQFQSVSLIPGLDISWYYNTFSIAGLFLMWTVSITFSKGE